MGNSMVIVILVLTTGSSVWSVQVNPNNYGGAREDLIIDIIKNQFPKCNVVTLTDNKFSHQMLRWLSALSSPVYSMSVNSGHSTPGKGNTWKRVGKRSRPSCSTVVISCESIETCRPESGESVHQLLLANANNILESEKRVLLILESETTTNLRVPQNESLDYPSPSFQVLKDITEFLATLRAHITLIRKLIQTTRKNSSREVFQTLTWTTNWFPGGTPILSNVWTSDKGFQFKDNLKISLEEIKPGSVLKVCVPGKHLAPSFHMNDNDTENLLGVDGALITLFANKFRFNVTIIEAADKLYGSRLDNGSWTGSMGYVIRKESDIAAGKLIFNAERWKADVNVGPAFVTLVGVVVCSIPEELPTWEVLILPFKPLTWIYVMAYFASLVLALELLQILLEYVFKPRVIWGWYNPLNAQRVWLPWIYSLGTIFKAPVPDRSIPRKTPFLLMFGTWLVCTFIIGAFFSKMLVGFLSFPPLERPVRSISDLVSRDGLPWSISSVVEEAIQDSHRDLETTLYNNRIELPKGNESWAIDLAGYKYVNNTKSCFVAERTRSRYYIQKYFTDSGGRPIMYVSDESFVIAPSGWFLRGDMDFELYSYVWDLFRYYQASGILQKVRDAMFPLRENWCYLDTEIDALKLSQLEVVFQLLLLGSGIAALTFLLELLIAWK